MSLMSDSKSLRVSSTVEGVEGAEEEEEDVEDVEEDGGGRARCLSWSRVSNAAAFSGSLIHSRSILFSLASSTP